MSKPTRSALNTEFYALDSGQPEPRPKGYTSVRTSHYQSIMNDQEILLRTSFKLSEAIQIILLIGINTVEDGFTCSDEETEVDYDNVYISRAACASIIDGHESAWRGLSTDRPGGKFHNLYPASESASVMSRMWRRVEHGGLVEEGESLALRAMGGFFNLLHKLELKYATGFSLNKFEANFNGERCSPGDIAKLCYENWQHPLAALRKWIGTHELVDLPVAMDISIVKELVQEPANPQEILVGPNLPRTEKDLEHLKGVLPLLNEHGLCQLFLLTNNLAAGGGFGKHHVTANRLSNYKRKCDKEWETHLAVNLLVPPEEEPRLASFREYLSLSDSFLMLTKHKPDGLHVHLEFITDDKRLIGLLTRFGYSGVTRHMYDPGPYLGPRNPDKLQA